MPPIAPNAIRDIVARRNITHLVHFTRIETLNSIFAKGLQPKSAVKALGATINNAKDPHDDCVCLSITHISNMLYPMQQWYPPDEGWCVIVLAPTILWKQPCRFFPVNAVSNVLKQRPVSDFLGAEALEAMFAEEVTDPKQAIQRRAVYLLANMPTNSQAEVHVIGHIHPRYFKKIYFHTRTDTTSINNMIRFPNHIERFKSRFPFAMRDHLLRRERKAYIKWLKDRFS